MAVVRIVAIRLEVIPVLAAQAIDQLVTDIGVQVAHDKKLSSRDISCINFFLDINECTENRDGCDQLCLNTVGSYLCNCTSGYRLTSDERTCHGKNRLYCVCDTIN